MDRRSGESYAAADLVSPVVAWDAEELAAAGVSAVVWRAVRQAATETSETWDHDREGGTTGEDVRAALGLLCDLVRRFAEQGEPQLGTFPTSVPTSRLLDALRRCFLAEVRRNEASFELSQVLVVLDAMERLAVAVDHDSAQRFVNRLSGPDAAGASVKRHHHKPIADFRVREYAPRCAGRLRAVVDVRYPTGDHERHRL